MERKERGKDSCDFGESLTRWMEGLWHMILPPIHLCYERKLLNQALVQQTAKQNKKFKIAQSWFNFLILLHNTRSHKMLSFLSLNAFRKYETHWFGLQPDIVCVQVGQIYSSYITFIPLTFVNNFHIDTVSMKAFNIELVQTHHTHESRSDNLICTYRWYANSDTTIRLLYFFLKKYLVQLACSSF